MSRRSRTAIDDLRGATRLALAATRSVTDVVEAMHRTIGGGPALLGQPFAVPVRLWTRLVYGAVRGVTQLVGAGIDGALAGLAPLSSAAVDGPERDAVLGVLNGVLGDYLHDTGNPLAIEMRLRHAGQALTLTRDELACALPAATGKLLLLVHGSCSNDRLWRRRGHDHGEVLARELGYTPIHVHYNSGRHVAHNGLELAGLLEDLVAAWPVPLEALDVLAHSMGGLVMRSACHLGEQAGHAWRGRPGRLVFLGTPHHGAPLERLGNWVEPLLDATRYTAPLARLGRLRSAGVTDLRFGCVLDHHGDGRDRFASHEDPRSEVSLPAGVACYAVAATLSAGPAARLRGDGVVPVDSALGRHTRVGFDLGFPADRQCIVHGASHLDLLDRPEVFAAVRAWLGAPAEPESARSAR